MLHVYFLDSLLDFLFFYCDIPVVGFDRRNFSTSKRTISIAISRPLEKETKIRNQSSGRRMATGSLF